MSDTFYLDNLFQFRRVDFFEYSKIFFDRIGVNYKPNDNLILGAGYFYLESHAYGTFHPEITRREHRFWEALTLKTKMGKTQLANRFIFEQRFRERIVDHDGTSEIDGFVYVQRFRYRLQANFNVLKLKNNKYILGQVADEIRVRFSRGLSDPDFDQNNFDVFLGYQLLDNSKVWLGYSLNYYKINSSNFLAENTLRVNFSYDFDFRKNKK